MPEIFCNLFICIIFSILVVYDIGGIPGEWSKRYAKSDVPEGIKKFKSILSYSSPMVKWIEHIKKKNQLNNLSIFITLDIT